MGIILSCLGGKHCNECKFPFHSMFDISLMRFLDVFFLSLSFAVAWKLININHNENQGKSMWQNRENLLFGIDCRTWPEGETTLFKRADLYGICAMLPWWKINVYSMPALSIFTSCAVWNKHIFLNLPVMSSSFLSLFFFPFLVPLSLSRTLTPIYHPASPLFLLFVPGSVDQFSACRVGRYLLLLPRPSNLSVTPTA